MSWPARGVATCCLLSLLWSCGETERGAVELPPLIEVGGDNPEPAMRARIEAALEAVERRPRDAAANGRLGMLYEVSRYPESARIAYLRATLLAPEDFRWHYLLARAELLLGNSEAAMGGVRTALELEPDYLPAHVQLGELLLERGDAAGARAAFEDALERDAGHAGAHLGLGRARAASGDLDGAIESYRAALELAPGAASIHYALGLAFRESGELDKAAEQLELARSGRQGPLDPDPLRAEVLSLETGLQSDYRQAVELLNAGRLEEAIEALEQFLRDHPDHYGAHGALGRALMLEGRLPEALAAYDRAVELNPTNIDFLRPRSLLLYRAGRFQEAERHLRQVMEMGGEHPDDHHVLGAILMRLDRVPEALAEFERALALAPDHGEAKGALLHLLRREMARAPSNADAVQYMERIVEVEPRDLQTWTILGGTLSELGDLRGAIDAFERALAINPELPEVVRRRDELRRRLESAGP